MSPAYEKIYSLSDYLKLIERNYRHKFTLFRGQRSDEPLIPRIGRLSINGDFQKEEEKIFKDFKLFSVPYITSQPNDEWDRIALAQHHGLPTRLLDWTENPLIALWFAVNKPPKKDDKGKKQDAVVWIFTPKQNHFVTEDDENPFTVTRTKVFQPKHIVKRISAQSGWFTVHKYMNKDRKFVRMEINKSYKNYLEKLVIPAEHFSDLRQSLDKCNINAATVFPDIDGLCSYIQWKHSLLEDENPNYMVEDDDEAEAEAAITTDNE